MLYNGFIYIRELCNIEQEGYQEYNDPNSNIRDSKRCKLSVPVAVAKRIRLPVIGPITQPSH